jgi:methionine biosynthesis protein MetW
MHIRPLRADLQQIAGWVQPGSRLLDLGCGDGELLAHLRDAKGCRGYGVEISDDHVAECVQDGINVIQSNLDEGLRMFADAMFDTVVLSQTLQAMHNVEGILREMARVARQGIVSFPNFGHWRHAFSLLAGRMPVTREIPYQWYDTPNIHLCSIDDFRGLCRDMGVRIERAIVLDRNSKPISLPPLLANLLGEQAVFMLKRD